MCWPFVWRFRHYQAAATELAIGPATDRMHAAVCIGGGFWAIPLEVDGGVCLWTNYVTIPFIGVLYRPGGEPPRSLWAYSPMLADASTGPPQAFRKEMAITYCRALSPEWYAVTWVWRE